MTGRTPGARKTRPRLGSTIRAAVWAGLMACCAARGADSPGLQEQMAGIKRVYVDRFTGGETAAHLRELIIASLQQTKLFVITENEQKADAILRGAAEDLVFTEQHQSSDSVNARVATSVGVGNTSRNTERGEGDRARYGGITIGEHESMNIKERKHEAFATVRLVNKDGDVIWSTTQESQGGKFRSASGDVAEKIARQLQSDVKVRAPR